MDHVLDALFLDLMLPDGDGTDRLAKVPVVLVRSLQPDWPLLARLTTAQWFLPKHELGPECVIEALAAAVAATV